jgi:hypothetical protein
MRIEYLWLAVLSVLLTILSFVLAPLLALGLDKDKNLKYGRALFQPPDNPAVGDSSWKREHPIDTDYELAVSYLWRNPAQGFQLGYAAADISVLDPKAPIRVYGNIFITAGVSVAVDGKTKIVGETGWYKVIIGKHWHWRSIKRWPFGIYTSSEFGWRLQGLAMGRPQDICRQMVFTPLRFIKFIT